jgi:hypothetical protein
MNSTRMLVGLLFVTALGAGAYCNGDPHADVMQELFDLSAQRTKTLLELESIDRRLAMLEKEYLAQFEKVAKPTGSEYWESVSDNVVSARASHEISKGELLLYHAPGIYRVKDSKPKLTTKGECWYFRPNRDIHKGQEFWIVLVHDAPEELRNVAAGFAPHSSRARDPERAYHTEIRISGGATDD